MAQLWFKNLGRTIARGAEKSVGCLKPSVRPMMSEKTSSWPPVGSEIEQNPPVGQN